MKLIVGRRTGKLKEINDFLLALLSISWTSSSLLFPFNRSETGSFSNEFNRLDHACRRLYSSTPSSLFRKPKVFGPLLFFPSSVKDLNLNPCSSTASSSSIHVPSHAKSLIVQCKFVLSFVMIREKINMQWMYLIELVSLVVALVKN